MPVTTGRREGREKGHSNAAQRPNAVLVGPSRRGGTRQDGECHAQAHHHTRTLTLTLTHPPRNRRNQTPVPTRACRTDALCREDEPTAPDGAPVERAAAQDKASSSRRRSTAAPWQHPPPRQPRARAHTRPATRHCTPTTAATGRPTHARTHPTSRCAHPPTRPPTYPSSFTDPLAPCCTTWSPLKCDSLPRVIAVMEWIE
jgi:hypothetical protein